MLRSARSWSNSPAVVPMPSKPPRDWYAELRLPSDASTDAITEAVERRSRQAAALANTAPERSQQLRDEVRTMKRDLLSGEQARRVYDASRAAATTKTADSIAQPPASFEPVPFWMQADSVEPNRDAAPGSAWPPMDNNARHSYGQQSAAASYQSRFAKFIASAYVCRDCGYAAQPRDRFCAQCGSPLKPVRRHVPVTVPVQHPDACAYCGTIAGWDHRFCRTCGAARAQGTGP
jgi:RNA polymerase subunit RPABC4/transcription elongation factor Spt4